MCGGEYDCKHREKVSDPGVFQHYVQHANGVLLPLRKYLERFTNL